jgi:hypothetical protein
MTKIQDKRWLLRSGALLVLLGYVLPTMTVSCGGIAGFEQSFSLNSLASQPDAGLLYLVPLGALVVGVLAFLPALGRQTRQLLFWGEAAGAGIGIASILIVFSSLRSQLGSVGFQVSLEFGALALIAGYGLIGAGLIFQLQEGMAGQAVLPGLQRRDEQPQAQAWSPPAWKQPKGKLPYLEETLPPFPDESGLQPETARETVPEEAYWPEPAGSKHPSDDRLSSRETLRVPPSLAGTGRLYLVKGDLAKSEFALDHDGFTIGREAKNDLRLPDPTVSRQHARLRYAQGAWYIQDLNSTAGICVNGKPVPAKRLEPGDEIEIGAYSFEFDMP